MTNSLGAKLIAVMDINNLKLFKAEGLKITGELGNYAIHSDANHKTERHEGFKGQKSGPSSFYDPHSSPKDIEYNESSKTAVKHINATFNSDPEFKEIYIVTDAKMLGHIRQEISGKLKEAVSKEVRKDLIHHKLADIEKAIFA